MGCCYLRLTTCLLLTTTYYLLLTTNYLLLTTHHLLLTTYYLLLLTYLRVRAVFEKMGNMTDSSTGKPLFNTTARKKANNVLKEILEGNAANLPGVEYYTQRLDSKGQPKVDRHGRALLDCERGTNRTEAAHKQIVTTFGTWSAGVHMSDCLMREWRHRFNQHVSERRRLGFPTPHSRWIHMRTRRRKWHANPTFG